MNLTRYLVYQVNKACQKCGCDKDSCGTMTPYRDASGLRVYLCYGCKLRYDDWVWHARGFSVREWIESLERD